MPAGGRGPTFSDPLPLAAPTATHAAIRADRSRAPPCLEGFDGEKTSVNAMIRMMRQELVKPVAIATTRKSDHRASERRT